MSYEPTWSQPDYFEKTLASVEKKLALRDQQVADLRAENERLREALKATPCLDHDVRDADKGPCFCGTCFQHPDRSCDCPRCAALGDQERR